MRKLILAILFPSPAFAACDGATLVSCSISGTHQLEVCQQGDDLTYTYSVIGRAPDLALREPLANGTYTPWNGIGRSMWESITFTNGNYTYEVFASFDRLDETAFPEQGVAVQQDGQLVTTLLCDPARGMTLFDTLSDEMDARSFCWNRDARAWATSCQD